MASEPEPRKHQARATLRKHTVKNAVVAVIGSSGFVGRHLTRALRERGVAVTGFGREARPGVSALPTRAEELARFDAIIHVAGIAHRQATADEYLSANVDLPLRLATLARDGGVPRFVFISTSQVHGRTSETPIAPDSPYRPPSEYAASKVRAERSLQELLSGSGVNLSIIRPPLVYAWDAKANFRALRAAARRGVPLPLGRATALRSMVSIHNLTDAISTVAVGPALQDAICLPADPTDLSVREIYAHLCRASGRPAIIPSAPKWLMRTALEMAGQRSIYESLFQPAVIDRRHWSDLGWEPTQTPEEGLRLAIRNSDS